MHESDDTAVGPRGIDLEPVGEGSGRDAGRPKLADGSEVAVIGGGPAGSFFAYFLLDMAERMDSELRVDVYEPRDFGSIGPKGCNHCGGIISESLVQALAAEGLNLPADVVQRGIESYVLHTDVGSVHIDTPLHEKRIGAVNRGSGRSTADGARWSSFDGYLQQLAVGKGARVLRERVERIDPREGRPRVRTVSGTERTYDLLGMAIGVNGFSAKLLAESGLDHRPPRTVKTFIREYDLGGEAITTHLGNSMHVFLPRFREIEFAALVPKGDSVTLCLLGQSVDRDVMQRFLDSPEVRRCMPPDWDAAGFACRCAPRINVTGAPRPFGHRVVWIGDCGVTRLYKDGIGAAYRTAKAAATTAVFHGISAGDFERHFEPTCRAIASDNAIGKRIFALTRQMQRASFLRRGLLRMIAAEQDKDGRRRPMSTILWDMFTGSAPYREILLRSLQPSFLARFLWNQAAALAKAGVPRRAPSARPAGLPVLEERRKR